MKTEPTEDDRYFAFQVWAFDAGRDFAYTMRKLIAERPLVLWDLGALHQWEKDENWSVQADQFAFTYGEAWDRSNTAVLRGLVPKALSVLNRALDGDLTLKTDTMIFRAAQDVLNRNGYSEKATEIPKAMPVPNASATSHEDRLAGARQELPARLKAMMDATVADTGWGR